MTHLCTNCNITWAALHSIDDEDGDESVEFCPVCKTDSYLVEGSAEAFICTLDGKVIAPATGKEKESPQLTIELQEMHYGWAYMEQRERELAEREDRALNAYHSLCGTDIEAAKQAYRNELNRQL